jgi:AraC-like DNA-binding protein
MEPVVFSPDGTLLFKPSLPRDWKGNILSGSQPFFYQGSFGTITVQKFYDPKFSICYAVASFLQKVKLSWKESSMFNLRYILEGGMRYRDDSKKLIKIRSGQFNSVWAPDRITSVEFQEGNFEMLMIAYEPSIVQELLPSFPQVRNFQRESSVQWIRDGRESYDLLNSHYKDEARRFFYETKIREHLLTFLQPSPKEGLEKFSDDEIERIYQVDHKILKDLNQHHSTEHLARFARMPEGKLISLFKEITGVSMFERYKEAKLQKARKYLLETDVQVKVLYEIVGYESYTGFVDAFKERFGLSPLRYRKKFRPFD